MAAGGIDWDDPLALADPMDESIGAAMGWQQPGDEDVVAADPAVVEALHDIAAMIAAAPAAAWWASGVDLDALRCTARYDEHYLPAEPLLTGSAARLAAWREQELTDDRRARAERPDRPDASWSGTWWSTPGAGRLPTTTRPLRGVGAVHLLWEEDSFGQPEALIWPVGPMRPSRVYEIDGPSAWTELVRRYPLDVTWARRQDWYRVTGRDGVWLIPDWSAVRRDYDAVHLTVLGYLATATRLLAVVDGTATVLAGWDPDQTWWLTDTLTLAEPEPTRWRLSDADGWRRLES